MPRNGSDIYSIPPGTEGFPDTTIESEKYNNYIHDVETDLNLPRPVSMGGTGATSADGALASLHAEKAGQQISNFDSDVWMAGSFYSLTGATAPPVAGHAFSGIAHITNANSMVVEAVDLTDPNNTPWMRVKTAGVWGAWIQGVSHAPIIVSDTPPAGAVDNTLWFESDSGLLYIRYNDGDTIQWTIACPQPDISTYAIKTEVDGETAALEANKVAKAGDTMGGPLVLSASPPIADLQAANKKYVDDVTATVMATRGVRYDVPQTLTTTQQQQARQNIGAPDANLVINGDFRINQAGYVSAAVLSAGAYGHDQWKAGASGGDYSFTQLKNSTQITIASGKSLIQPIEDVNVVGGSYVLSWTGTAQARAGVNTLTPSGSYAGSPLLIAGQTAGTAMSVEFNDGTLGTVKLESGANTTPFIMRPFDQELMLCKRYYEKSYAYATKPGTAVGAGTNGIMFGPPPVAAGFGMITLPYSVEKRAAPTVVFYAGNGAPGAYSYFDGGIWNDIAGGADPGISSKAKFLAFNKPAATNIWIIGFDYTATARL